MVECCFSVERKDPRYFEVYSIHIDIALYKLETLKGFIKALSGHSIIGSGT